MQSISSRARHEQVRLKSWQKDTSFHQYHTVPGTNNCFINNIYRTSWLFFTSYFCAAAGRGITDRITVSADVNIVHICFEYNIISTSANQ